MNIEFPMDLHLHIKAYHLNNWLLSLYASKYLHCSVTLSSRRGPIFLVFTQNLSYVTTALSVLLLYHSTFCVLLYYSTFCVLRYYSTICVLRYYIIFCIVRLLQHFLYCYVTTALSVLSCCCF